MLYERWIILFNLSIVYYALRKMNTSFTIFVVNHDIMYMIFELKEPQIIVWFQIDVKSPD